MCAARGPPLGAKDVAAELPFMDAVIGGFKHVSILEIDRQKFRTCSQHCMIQVVMTATRGYHLLWCFNVVAEKGIGKSDFATA